MSDLYPKGKKVTREIAAQVINQFSPLDLYHTETRAIIEGNYEYPAILSRDDRERIRRDAIEYENRLKRVRQEFGQRAMLFIMLDRTANALENGRSLNDSWVELDGEPMKDGFKNPFNTKHVKDYSIDNWELSADGLRSRGYQVSPPYETREFGIWSMDDVKYVRISNYVDVGSYSYSEELVISRETDGNYDLGYPKKFPTGVPRTPFYDTFSATPGWNNY